MEWASYGSNRIHSNMHTSAAQSEAVCISGVEYAQAKDAQGQGGENIAAGNLNVQAGASPAAAEEPAQAGTPVAVGAQHADTQLALQQCKNRLQQAHSELDAERDAHCRTRLCVAPRPACRSIHSALGL